MSFKKFGPRYLKGFRDFRVDSDVTSEAIESFLCALDCPRALTVALLWRNSEHEQLAALEFNPLHYESSAALRDAYTATKFLSKFKGLSLDYDLDEVAMQKFEEFELLCKQTNSRFRNLSLDPKYRGRAVWLHHAVIRKIERILGDFGAEEFFSMPDWGPGATTLIKRRDASSVKKFQCETGITRDLYDLVPLTTLEGFYPLWARQLNLAGYPTFQVGNKVITVPKDAKSNRVIAIEPGINLWFQMAVGKMIARRLRRSGVDLRYQSRNQQLARKGSIDSRLATVDLSSASDSISSSVVEALLPPRWFHLMDACRSHYGVQSSQSRKWEKFSSMGNGFTFQLESLIFFAVAKSCAEYLHVDTSDVSAYGDDVILPTVCFELFAEMMDFYGFRINRKKSHYDSYFRESCGAHYISGLDVKPVYLKDRLTSVPSVYRFANAVRRLAHRRNEIYGCDARLRPVFELLKSKVPTALRLLIPENLGDGGFIVCFDEATPSRARHGIEGYLVPNAVEAAKHRHDESEGYLLASLWSLEGSASAEMRELSSLVRATLLDLERGLTRSHARLKATVDAFSDRSLEGRNSVPLSGRTSVRIVRSLVQQWYDLGPWI